VKVPLSGSPSVAIGGGETRRYSGSTRRMPDAIERFTRQWNSGAGPFRWVKTPADILAKAVRKTQADSGARH
jgi:hypothetical protein